MFTLEDSYPTNWGLVDATVLKWEPTAPASRRSIFALTRAAVATVVGYGMVRQGVSTETEGIVDGLFYVGGALSGTAAVTSIYRAVNAYFERKDTQQTNDFIEDYLHFFDARIHEAL